MNPQHPTGSGVVISAALATVSWVDQIDMLIRWGAGVAAIVAAVLTAANQLKTWRERNK